MATWTLLTINTSIENTLATAANIKRSQDIADLTESVSSGDLPLLMVYLATQSSPNEQTNKSTFGATADKVKRHEFTYNCDVYISTTGLKLSESMTNTMTLWQQLIEILDGQHETPFFGDDAIKSMNYTSEFATLAYANQDFRGIRIKVTVQVF